jgi:hypothetical protein
MINAKDKYRNHMGRARRRNIPFLLTFDEWLSIWEQSGHSNNRGPNEGQYCMSRYNDLGNYEVGNVFIQLSSENAKQGRTGMRDGIRTKLNAGELYTKRVRSIRTVPLRKVMVKDIIYNTIKEASNELNVSQQCIRSRIVQKYDNGSYRYL